MSYTLTIEARAGYLYVSVTGENSLDTVNRYLSEVRGECIKRKCFNLLIVENLSGPSLDTFSIYNLVAIRSEQASKIVKKLAYVDINPEHNARNMEFAEDVAVNRGMSIKVCPTIHAAEEWMESNA
jgi:hypothetical protein